MRFGKVLGLATVLVLTACAGRSVNWATVRQQADDIRTECDASAQAAGIPWRTKGARCAQPQILALYGRYRFPYMDLIELGEAQRVAIAERSDRGDLTSSEAAAAIAEIRARVNSDVASRDGARSAGDAAAAARAGVMLQMMPRAPMTCSRVGVQTVCN